VPLGSQATPSGANASVGIDVQCNAAQRAHTFRQRHLPELRVRSVQPKSHRCGCQRELLGRTHRHRTCGRPDESQSDLRHSRWCTSGSQHYSVVFLIVLGGNPGPEHTVSYPECPGATVVSGIIDTPQTWSGEILVVGDVTIASDLTILPGTQVFFDPLHDAQASGSDYSRCELILAGGTLTASGTAENRSSSHRPQ